MEDHLETHEPNKAMAEDGVAKSHRHENWPELLGRDSKLFKEKFHLSKQDKTRCLVPNSGTPAVETLSVKRDQSGQDMPPENKRRKSNSWTHFSYRK